MTASRKIIAMGEVMLELSPAAAGFALSYAGDTFNTAIHLARQGVATGYLTELGRDQFSDAIVALGESEGLSMSACQRHGSAMPGLYLIENDATGERQFHYWRDNSAARHLLRSADKLQQVCAVVDDWEIFYLSGISLAVLGQGAEAGFWRLMAHLRARGKSVVFDPNFRPRLWPDIETARDYYRRMLGYCDVVLATLEDDTLLWGLSEPEEVIAWYRSFGVTEVVLKLPRASAMAWVDGETIVRSSTYRGPVVDTTGAGDAFNAGYLAARYRGELLPVCIEAGHALAARVIAVAGAIPPVEERLY